MSDVHEGPLEWGEIIEDLGRHLAKAANGDEARKLLDDVNRAVEALDRPEDFWQELEREYERALRDLATSTGASPGTTITASVCRKVIAARARR
jgi:hypothetical protein